jgi:flavin-dependent dehydrogenase
LLCGEAACLISPSSAEGISYAIRSAKYCADALNTSFKDALPEYKKNCKPLLERLLRKFEKSDMIKDKSKRKKLFA